MVVDGTPEHVLFAIVAASAHYTLVAPQKASLLRYNRSIRTVSHTSRTVTRKRARQLLSPLLFGLVAWSQAVLWAQPVPNGKYGQADEFRQLEEILPTPNEYRAASGAPGHRYWQQRVDYVIDVELDDLKQTITGSETVTYANNSPDTLRYLWLQIDNNIFRPDSDASLTAAAPHLGDRLPFRALRGMLARETFEGGVNITSVADEFGKPLRYAVVKTMLRVDLNQPLSSGETTTFSVKWNYQFRVRPPRGTATLKWVGLEVKVKWVWLYFEVPLPQGLQQVRFRNDVFFEILPDQVNTVNFRRGKQRASLLFDREHPRRAYPGGED